MGKRCMCIALVLILVTTIGLAPLAQPAEAVAGVVVAGAVVAVMAMAGITIITSGMTAAQIQDWVEDKLEEWAEDVGSPLDHLINSAGIGVTISGLLTIGSAAAQGISDFITWLRSDLSITDNSVVSVVSSSANVDDIQGAVVSEVLSYVYDSGLKKYFVHTFDSNNPVFVFLAKTDYYSTYRYYLYAYSNSQFSVYATYEDAPSANGYVTVYGNGSRYWSILTNFVYDSNPIYNNHFDPELYMDNYVSGWSLSNWNSYLENTAGQVVVEGGNLSVSTGVITLPQVQNDDKVFIDVGALPGSTVSEVTEGVFSDVADDNLDVSGTVAEEEPEYVITGPVSVSGLDDIFPFCIPFDLYHMLEALAADPVAPHFEWRFYVPRLVDYTIVIDLSGFNTVAQILRLMETLLFCVGLAFETRKLLRS